MAVEEITFSKLRARLILDNIHQWDSVMAIDGADSGRHGPVGVGKTAIMLQLLLTLHPHATIANNVVIKDDYEHYQALLLDPTEFIPIGVDEAEWFFYKRSAMTTQQKRDILQFMSNRKEKKFHLFCLPRIWDLDIVMLYERVQWRLKIEKRGVASLYMRNSPSKWDKDRDLWGEHVVRFHDIPMPPDYIWNEYMRCIYAYIPAVWEGTGANRFPAVPARRADDIWEPEQPLSPRGYINPADFGGGHGEKE